MSTVIKDLGTVTAYAYAVEGGYTGTEEEFEEMLAGLAGTMEEIENLSATATSLPSTDSATASYADGVLSFGIPRGADGAQGATGATGPQGPQGPQGDDYVLTSQDKQDIAQLVEDMYVVTVSGSNPVINGVANTRYICGTVQTISITPPQTGIIDVIFTSGSTVAVVTLPATVKMPNWYSIETNTTYEINIMDGVYGAVLSWAE